MKSCGWWILFYKKIGKFNALDIVNTNVCALHRCRKISVTLQRVTVDECIGYMQRRPGKVHRLIVNGLSINDSLFVNIAI